MRAGNRVLAVIPARGGSKGIPRKNITPVAGRPLICHTTDFLPTLPWIDLAVVSTDDPDIAKTAQRAGTAQIVQRPADLSGDQVGDLPVLAHALDECESQSTEPFDLVLMLQPTSPLRTPQDVEKCIDKLITEAREAVWTVSPTDSSYHPEKQVKLAGDGAVSFFIESGSGIVARQQLQPAYHRNGACYAFTANFIRTGNSVFAPDNTAAIVCSSPQISIDTEEDIHSVEIELLRQGV